MKVLYKFTYMDNQNLSEEDLNFRINQVVAEEAETQSWIGINYKIKQISHTTMQTGEIVYIYEVHENESIETKLSEETPDLRAVEIAVSPGPLGPPVGYIDILNVATEDYIKEDALKARNPIRPSSAGACTRELAFKLMEFTGQAQYDKPLITPETHRIFSSGHALEYDLIKQFEKHCKDFFAVKYKQVPLDLFDFQHATREDLRMWVEGSNDLCFIAPSWRCVIDVKTKKDKFSSWTDSTWNEMTDKLKYMATVKVIGDIDPRSRPTSFWVEDLESFLKELNDPFFEANFVQLNSYAHSDFMKKRNVDHAAIIQYNKNDQRLREIRFKPHQGLFDKLKIKFATAIAAADMGDPLQAPRDYMLGSMKCAFCDYNKTCWAADTSDDPLKTYFKTLPPKYWARSVEMLQVPDDIKAEVYAARDAFEAAEKNKDLLAQAEERFVKAIVATKQTKIKFDKDSVFEVKYLKSPKPQTVIRRTKEK